MSEKNVQGLSGADLIDAFGCSKVEKERSVVANDNHIYSYEELERELLRRLEAGDAIKKKVKWANDSRFDSED